jgi:hypothetical protein
MMLRPLLNTVPENVQIACYNNIIGTTGFALIA